MTWFTGLIAFILIWWTVLFTVLPWGIRHETEIDPAERSPGAPVNPGLPRKFMITTIVALAVWGGIYVAIEADILDFRDISMEMAQEDKQK